MIGKNIITLEQFALKREKEFAYATGDLTQIMFDISLASKIVSREVNKAGLVDILGKVGEENVQGEEVQKLDVYANNHFIQALSMGGKIAVIGSEENEEIIPVKHEKIENAKYVLMMDPLDGSSNIDVNVSIGTIFSVFRRKTSGKTVDISDCLQNGMEQVAAGYVIYGSSTMLVYTTGHGVNGFTLDVSIGEFILSHPDIQMPKKKSSYSVNEGNFVKFDEKIQSYIKSIKTGEKPYSLRYIGSLVADFHRILLKGGVFLYPALSSHPNGKLRLMYEANPIAFIAEQAGGKASNGKSSIMKMEPQELHQRTPLFVGSAEEVDKIEEFLAD